MQETADLVYDPESGKFWRQAGCLTRAGYRQIKFQGRQHLEHRVAWFLHYGAWPERHIDHINGIKWDNRITNLRLATPSENQRNRPRPCSNTSGHKGVSWIEKYQVWQATIKFDGKNKNLGRFLTRETAADAYNSAALKHHGNFANVDL